MCGGRGTRLDADVEKPLFAVGGRPMVDRVRDALATSRIETTYAVVSPYAPETRAHVAGDLPLVETPGEGYVADLTSALERVEMPVLTVAADLPLLAGEVVDTVALERRRVDERARPRALKRHSARVATARAVGTDRTERRGRGRGRRVPGYDARLAVNVNRRSDAELAERLLAAGR